MPETAPVARRIPYDANGSLVLYQLLDEPDPSAKDLEVDFPGSVAELNDEDDAAVAASVWVNGRNRIIIVLPEKWDIAAYLIGHNGTLGGVTIDGVATSVDTTTGEDGTWVQHGSPSKTVNVFQDYRDPTLWSVAGVKGFRVTLNGLNIEDYTAIHLWGTITAGENPDRLEFINDATGNPFLTSLDGGNVARGGSVDRDIRLRNLSATLTANNITLSAEELYQPGGNDAGAWYTFSLNGATGPFQSSQNIASLGPGAEQVIRVRRVIPATVVPNKHAPRFKAVAGSWT